MIKKLLFPAILCLLAFSLNAQKVCDLKMSITNPVNNVVVPYGDTVHLFATIQNNGPDTIMPTDTIWYQAIGFPAASIVYGVTMFPGDTITRRKMSGWADNNQVINDTSTICLEFILSNNFADPVSSNNQACVTVIMLGSNTTSIRSNLDLAPNVILAPNPIAANSVASIAFDKPIKSNSIHLVLRSIDGRQITIDQPTISGKTLQFKMPDLPSQTVFLEVFDKETNSSKIVKLSVIN